uniref:Uncharacterized protein n=1 Tax=Arundo donax TaxID=35708 RepID=A0A0A9B4U9_ARUDO
MIMICYWHMQSENFVETKDICEHNNMQNDEVQSPKETSTVAHPLKIILAVVLVHHAAPTTERYRHW